MCFVGCAKCALRSACDLPSIVHGLALLQEGSSTCAVRNHSRMRASPRTCLRKVAYCMARKGYTLEPASPSLPRSFAMSAS